MYRQEFIEYLDGICQILHVVNKSMMFPNI